MKYQPNFADARASKRIRMALGFARGVMSEETSHSWSTRYIDKYLGQQQNPLSQWLRQHLLIVEDHSYSYRTGKCKSYKLNPMGYEYVKCCANGLTTQSMTQWLQGYTSEKTTNNAHSCMAQIDHAADQEDSSLVSATICKKFSEELATGAFEYTDKSSRLWHPIQGVKKKYKNQILAQSGFKYHYDIQCAAPTLLHQYSQQLGMDLWLPALQSYLKDRAAFRAELARDCEVDSDTIKRVINALFAGAHLSHKPDTHIIKMLADDHARVEFLKQHELMTQLRADIKIMWQYIKPTLQRKTITNSKGNQQLVPINSKQKWGVYFDLERQVLNAVRTYLQEKNIKSFLEHDGWATSEQLCEDELISHVLESTGFRIQLSSDEFREQVIENFTGNSMSSESTNETTTNNLPLCITSLDISINHSMSKEITEKSTTETTTNNLPLCITSLGLQQDQANLLFGDNQISTISPLVSTGHQGVPIWQAMIGQNPQHPRQ